LRDVLLDTPCGPAYNSEWQYALDTAIGCVGNSKYIREGKSNTETNLNPIRSTELLAVM